jgi:very-short-patch-repair endonuclease
LTEKKHTRVARGLRRRGTDAEQRLWRHIRSRQLEHAKFVRQFPIGGYIADFACRSAGLIIELDGGQHSVELDAARTTMIESFGYRVIRFWNNDIFENMEGVLKNIRRELALARNDPLPRGSRQGEGVQLLDESAPSPLTRRASRVDLSPVGRGGIGDSATHQP